MKSLPILGALLCSLVITSPCSAEADRDALIAKEKQVFEAFKAKNANAFATQLTEDFIGVDDTGVLGKAAEVKSVSDADIKDFRLTDIKVVNIDKDAAILTYKITQRGTYKGESIPTTVFGSSVWVNRDGRWFAVFHQETPARSQDK